MKKSQTWLIFLLGTVAIALTLAGCASMQKNEVTDIEGLLTEAGFQKHAADTPEKMAHLKTLPQQHFSRHKENGKVYVIYADAADCQCMYVGSETQFQHYRDLERQQGMDSVQMDRSEYVTGVQWSKSPWGPFDQ